MKRALLGIITVCMFLGITGCATKSPYMQPADVMKSERAPGMDEAKIVFFRSSNLGGAVQSWVCEAVDGKLEYIAIIPAKTKIAHFTRPGKHTYLTGGENSELMEATLDGGKTYYAYIEPRMGIWKARFGFEPVKQPAAAAGGFKSDLAGCEWQESNAGAMSWFNDNLSSLQEKYDEALKDFNTNPERKILSPGDGL